MPNFHKLNSHLSKIKQRCGFFFILWSTLQIFTGFLSSFQLFVQKFDQLHLWIQNQVSRCTPKPLSVCCFSDRCLRDVIYFGRSYHVFPLGFLSSETNFSRHWFLKKYISKWLCKKNRNEYTSWEQAWTTS